MSKLAVFPAAVIVAAAALISTPSEARSHHRHHRHHLAHDLPYAISYLHNYGPGPLPGTFAFYDGPSTSHCYQSAAAYIGQDHRRHPCF